MEARVIWRLKKAIVLCVLGAIRGDLAEGLSKDDKLPKRSGK